MQDLTLARGGSRRAVEPMVARVPKRKRCKGSSTRYAGGQGAVLDNPSASEKRLSIGSTALSARWRGEVRIRAGALWDLGLSIT